mmetsp:Transcript_45068/g.133422  ORF Transcript_45068/g.133422 Transcript_45068/m.133422 type:complete len:223 (+) Transcript_45068:931-1599(+)
MWRRDPRDRATRTQPLVPRSRRWHGAAACTPCLFQTHRMRLPSTPSQCGVEQVAHPEGLYITVMSFSGTSFSMQGWVPVPPTTTPLVLSKASALTKRFGFVLSQKGAMSGSQCSLPEPARRLAGNAPAAPSSFSVFWLPFSNSIRMRPLFMPPAAPAPASSEVSDVQGRPSASASTIEPSGRNGFRHFGLTADGGAPSLATAARIAAAAASSSSLSISKSAS